MVLRIRNCLEKTPVSFLFETLPPEEEFDPKYACMLARCLRCLGPWFDWCRVPLVLSSRSFRAVTNASTRCRYLWRGTTRLRVPDLAPSAIVDIKLCATFFNAGQFNLNRFRFTVETAEQKPRVFFFPLQHLIAVGSVGAVSAGGSGSGSISAASLASTSSASAAGPSSHAGAGAAPSTPAMLVAAS